MPFFRFLHLLTFIFWYGTILYFTFVQAPILFKSLPREMFGLVQSKLFPAYYLISYACGSILVVTYFILHPTKGWTSQDWIKLSALCLMFGFSLAQGLWIGPRVAQLRLDRQAAEESKNQSKISALSQEFGKAHGLSSLLNLLVVISGLVFLVYFSRHSQTVDSILKGIF